MKNLIKLASVLLIAMPSFAGDFIMGATSEGVDTVYVKPIGDADSCLVPTSAEVTVTQTILPKPIIPKQRVCRSDGFEIVTIVNADGEETQMERPRPYICEYCHRDSSGSYINCTATNSVIVEAPDVIVTANNVDLNFEYEEALTCDSVYLALPVTPGRKMTITMPDEVKLIDMKITLGENDSALENVNYEEVERVVPQPARISN